MIIDSLDSLIKSLIFINNYYKDADNQGIINENSINSEEHDSEEIKNLLEEISLIASYFILSQEGVMVPSIKNKLIKFNITVNKYDSNSISDTYIIHCSKYSVLFSC